MSDSEDDDLESLRLAALSTLKPKAQPIQQVIGATNRSSPQQGASWHDFPPGAHVTPEYKPHLSSQPRAYTDQNVAPSLASRAQNVPVPGLQQAPAQHNRWRQPFNNGVPGARTFHPQGRFPVDNRRPYNARAPHRSFGDQSRPPFDRTRRFPRREYVMQGNGGGRGPPRLATPAGGNLIVVQRAGEAASAKQNESKLQLPQDKYHSSSKLTALSSDSQQQSDDSEHASKPRDKFARYDDSDQSDEEEEVEEEHSDLDDITKEIDNFLNDVDAEDTSSDGDGNAGPVKDDTTDRAEADRADTTDRGETKNVEADKTKIEEKKQSKSDEEDLLPEADSDAESLDLDALATGGLVFEEDVPDVKADPVLADGITDKGDLSKLVEKSPEPKGGEKFTNSNSNVSSAGSSSTKNDSSGDEGVNKKQGANELTVKTEKSVSDKTNLSPQSPSHPSDSKADAEISLHLEQRSSMSPVSLGSLSPLLDKEPPLYNKSPSPQRNRQRRSLSPRHSPHRRSPLSPNRATHSKRYSKSPTRPSYKHRSPSHIRRNSPTRRHSISPRRRWSPRRRSPISPRRRSRSPGRRSSASPRGRLASSKHQGRTSPRKGRSPPSNNRQSRGYMRDGRDERRDRHTSGGRIRSRSRERHKASTEASRGKDNPAKTEIVTKVKKEEETLPPIDLEKLTPEERSKIEARRKKFSSSEITIDPSKKVSLKGIKERPKKQKSSKEESKSVSGEDKVKKEAKPKIKERLKEKMPKKSGGSKEEDADLEDDEESDDQDSGRAWRNRSNFTAKPIALSTSKSKAALLSLDSIKVPRDEFGSDRRHPAPGMTRNRSAKERLGVPDVRNSKHRSHHRDFREQESEEEAESPKSRLTSSIVRAKPYKADIPVERLKIEVQVSKKEKKEKTKSKAKPNFSEVYSVPAKRHIIEKEDEDEMLIEEDDVEIEPVKKLKKSDKKQKLKSKSKPNFSEVYSVPAKRHIVEREEEVEETPVEDEESVEIEPVKKLKKNKKKKKHSRERYVEEGGESVLEEEEVDTNPDPAPSRPSIMDRLGKKVALEPATEKEKKKKKKRKHAEDAEPASSIDKKMLKMKEMNEAIARRQREIQRDKELYG